MRRLVLAYLVALCAVPAVGAAQERDCNYRMLDPAGRAESVDSAEGALLLIHAPFEVLCDDGAELRALSGNLNRTTRVVYLVGDVFFRDGERTLTSHEATYNAETAWLWARGDVVFVDALEGSTLRGPELEYFQATEERPQAQMTATQRPTLTITRRDAAADAEPMDIVAERISTIGDEDLSAFGEVVITRGDLRATSEEARYNSVTEDLELRQNAVIRTEERELTGEVIQARLVDGALEHLHSRTNASLRGDDLRVTAADLQLFFAEELLQRAIARGPGATGDTQARAASATFRIEADSLDAVFADQQLERVNAIGNAHGESIDTATVAVAVSPTPDGDTPMADASGDPLGSDWIRGDTIFGFFVAVAAAADEEPAMDPVEIGPPIAEAEPGMESAEPRVESSVELKRLIAIGSAQSHYRMRGENDGVGRGKNLNFLVGDRIELELVDGELDIAQVEGLQYGLYLEPQATAPTPTTSPEVAPAGAGLQPEGGI